VARVDRPSPPLTGQHRHTATPPASDRMRDALAHPQARRSKPQPDPAWVDGWALVPYLGAAWRDGLTVVPRLDMMPRPASPHAQRRGGLLGALGNPLYRSGYALIANVVGTTVVGLGFWAIAAHLYSRRQVGQASALVAALVVVSSFAQLNLNNTLPRFLTQAGRRAGRLLGYGYAASSATALVLGLAFITVLPRLSPNWHFLGSSVLLSAAFVAAIVVWGVFALQDCALLGLQRPIMVPLENSFYGVAKLVVLLGVTSLLPDTGIFIAWIIPLAINVPVVNWLIFRRYLKDWKPATAVATVRPRDIMRFTWVDYVGNMLSQTAGNLLPLLVLTALGAAADAIFYIAWTIATGLNLVATGFATSLLVEGSAMPGRLGELTRGILARNLVVTVAGAAVLGLGARLILSIYGHGYAVRASLLLGLLAAGSVFYGLLAIVFSVDRIVGRVGRATVTRLVLAVLTLGGSWLLLRRMGTDGVGVAWLGANMLVALARLPTIVRATRLRAGQAVARSTARTPAARHRAPARSRPARQR
jgi:O-antigen/teichoic acid export membrane protein